MKRLYIVLLIGFVALIPFRSARAAQLLLSTINPTVKVNEKFSVTISLSDGDQTLGTDMVLRYDPQRLVAQEVREGSLYPTYNPTGEARINKDSGVVVLSGSTGFGQSVPANGVFATVSFVALKDGRTTISLDYERGATNKTGVVSPSGEELLTGAPAPLPITIKRQSLFGALLSFFQSLWKR